MKSEFKVQSKPKGFSVPSDWKETELGMIPCDWDVKLLTDLLINYDFQRIPLSKMQRNNKKGIYPYYGASGIIDYVNEYIFDGEYLLISEDGENLKSRNTPIAFLVSGKFWVNNHSHILKSEDNFTSRFIFYSFQNLDVNPYLTGSVQPKLSQSQLNKILILIPSNEDEQKAIAKILSDLDDKIDCNRKINDTLEELGQTLFKRWFVDFEFLNEEGKPYKSSGGEMIESELGLIPKGWRVDNLGNHVKFIKGKKPLLTSNKKEENYLQQILMDTFNGSIKVYADKTNTIIVDINDVLMVMDGASSGRVEIGYKGVLGSTLAKLKTNELLNYYTYFYLKSKEQELNANTTGTSIPHTDKGRINNSKIVLASKEIYFHFNKHVTSIINKRILLREEIQSLQQIRDSLLPKLMSGQIRVK
ncbi:MAG: restriction endonuclease subunit S [Nanoarchaeota archaeon]|nr:restriction endonuclease subunit S [Nanoarchaeota archaeon]